MKLKIILFLISTILASCTPATMEDMLLGARVPYPPSPPKALEFDPNGRFYCNDSQDAKEIRLYKADSAGKRKVTIKTADGQSQTYKDVCQLDSYPTHNILNLPKPPHYLTCQLGNPNAPTYTMHIEFYKFATKKSGNWVEGPNGEHFIVDGSRRTSKGNIRMSGHSNNWKNSVFSSAKSTSFSCFAKPLVQR